MKFCKLAFNFGGAGKIVRALTVKFDDERPASLETWAG